MTAQTTDRREGVRSAQWQVMLSCNAVACKECVPCFVERRTPTDDADAAAAARRLAATMAGWSTTERDGAVYDWCPAHASDRKRLQAEDEDAAGLVAGLRLGDTEPVSAAELAHEAARGDAEALAGELADDGYGTGDDLEAERAALARIVGNGSLGPVRGPRRRR